MEKIVNQYPIVEGIYNHYKGGRYQVISLAKHSETGEDMVVYKSIHFGSVYVRPLSMWFDTIKVPWGIHPKPLGIIDYGSQENQFNTVQRFTLTTH
jgi:hypothetical protein